MKLYGGIDLHSNNNVIVLSDEEDRVIYRRRLPNDIELVLPELALFGEDSHETGKGLDLPAGRSQRSVKTDRKVATRSRWTRNVHRSRAASMTSDPQHLVRAGNRGISGAASSQGPGAYPPHGEAPVP